MTNQLNEGDIIRVNGQCFPYTEGNLVWTDFEILSKYDYDIDFQCYNCISLSTNQKSKEFNLKFHPKIGWFHTNEEKVTGLIVTNIIVPHWSQRDKKGK